MDSDDSFNPDDHGLNMDPAPASHDEPSTNLDTLPANFEDSGAHTGPSTSRPVTTAKEPLRCVNCGLNVTRIRRHLLEIAEVRNHIQQWVQQQVEVSRESFVCHSCWTAAWSQIRNPTQQQNAPPARHGQACISCGRSIVRQRSHSLMSDSPRVELVRNVIARHIGTNELPSSSRVCHNCWRRNNRAVSQSTEEPESSRLPSLQPEVANAAIEADRQEQIEADYQDQQALNTSGVVLLPNYVRAPNTQSHCFFPGCNSSKRLTVPSALRVQLFCEYNYYVPPDCRICHYHLHSNSWHLILEATYNPIKTFSVAQIEEFASLLKDNMFNHLDFENIQNMTEHTIHYYLGVSKAQFQEILCICLLFDV